MDNISSKKNFFFHNTWEAESFIGAGNYGKVYKAVKVNHKDSSVSAIKSISLKKSKNEISRLLHKGKTILEIENEIQESIDSVLAEIELMKKFKGSSHIVLIDDYEIIKYPNILGVDIHIRMDLLQVLEDYYKNREITNHDIIKLGIDISYALKDLENAKIIHRDIKPGNIFVDQFGNYKLGDFGLACSFDKIDFTKKGTYYYIAPEIYHESSYDKSVDVYSLGVILYQFFNYNRYPFYPVYPKKIFMKDRDLALFKKCNGEKISKPVYATDEEAKVILKMLEYDPKNRYQNLSKLISDLEKLLDSKKRIIPFPKNAIY